MNTAEEFDATTWEPTEIPARGERAATPPHLQTPEWERENALIYAALRQWFESWERHARSVELERGERPSTLDKSRHLARYRRTLLAKYGRGEPDPAWLERRVEALKQRGKRRAAQEPRR